MPKQKMTVRSALDTHKSIEEYVTYLNALRQVLESDPELHDKVQAKSGEYLPDGWPKEPVYQINGAVNTLSKYGRLLKDAIDRTEMDWPGSLD